MPSLRRTRFLTCFYCGRPSKARNDGTTRQFLCLHCDATNHLDENGDITDPPVATTTESQATTQYAIHRSALPTTTRAQTSAQAIFCAQCLKNQHLFTSSLAQYLPDDPNHPDYAELERNYYKFRARLEQRYPQMCAQCEPKVLGKLDQAGYTARTDFLRRMMDRSRMNRATPRRRTLLDAADTLGRWAWWAGYVFQALWHLSVVDSLFRSDLRLGETGWRSVVLDWLGVLMGLLPSATSLVALALRTTVFGAWWNPKFPQVYRGFSRHILGLPQWYTLQAILVAFRYFFPKFAELDADTGDQMAAQLTIHFFVAVMTIYVGILARKSVRQDTTPLFAMPSASTSSQRRVPHQQEAASQNLSHVLDEILETPPPKAERANSLQQVDSLSSLHLSPTTPGHGPPNPGSGVMRTSVQYSAEMDWSPTQAPPPAFQSIPHKSQPFGQRESAESQPQHAFWAKVPPAPKPPAQRLFNPMPPAKESIKQDRENFTARFGSGRLDLAPSSQNGSSGAVDFRQPTFFPKERLAGQDPTSKLADMLSKGFSLGQDPVTPPKKKIRIGNPFSPRRDQSEPAAAPQIRSSRVVDSVILAALLGAWAFAGFYLADYSAAVMKFALALACLITLRVAKDTLTSIRAAGVLSPTTAVGSLLCAGELGAAAYLGNRTWASEDACESCAGAGLCVLGVMLAHQLWSALW